MIGYQHSDRHVEEKTKFLLFLDLLRLGVGQVLESSIVEEFILALGGVEGVTEPIIGGVDVAIDIFVRLSESLDFVYHLGCHAGIFLDAEETSEGCYQYFRVIGR